MIIYNVTAGDKEVAKAGTTPSSLQDRAPKQPGAKVFNYNCNEFSKGEMQNALGINLSSFER